MGRHPGQILFLFAYLIKGKMLSCRGRGLVYGCIAELQLCINRMWIIIIPRRVLSGEEFPSLAAPTPPGPSCRATEGNPGEVVKVARGRCPVAILQS